MKKVCYVIMMLVSSLLFLENANAVTAGESVESKNPVEGTHCSVSSALERDIRIKLESLYGPGEKYGYMYDLTINGEQAFCITMGAKKGNVKELFFKGFHDNGALDRDVYSRYYRAYNYFLKFGNDSEQFAFVQAAFWYFADSGKTSDVLTIDLDEFTSYLSQVLFTSRCDEYEKFLQGDEYFGSGSMKQNGVTKDGFSCDCFLSKSCEQYDKYDSYITTKQYMQSVNAYYFSISSGQYDIMDDVASRARSAATGILTAQPYEGNLYYWKAVEEGTQDFITTAYFCDDETEKCEWDLEDLLDKYSAGVRTNTNSSYMTELNKLKQKYPDELNIDDITNPICDTPPPTTDPECDPFYEEYFCKFTSDNGGFYISDTGSETDNACWLDAGISYNYEEDIVSSDTNLGNEYCPVRCWEAFGADFPGAVDNIKAGTFFFWGRGSSEDGYLGNLNAARYCQTVGIDYTKFRSDFNNNEAAVLVAYNRYKAQEAYNAGTNLSAGDACHTDADSNQCNYTETSSVNRSDYLTSSNNYQGTTCDAHYGVGGWSSCTDPQSGAAACCRKTTGKVCSSCKDSNYEVKDGTCKKKGKNYTKTVQYYGGQSSTATTTTCIPDTATDKNAEFISRNGLSAELTSRKNALQSAITTREGLTKKIRSCQSQEYINVGNADLYTFKGEVKLNYTDPAGINRNIDGAVLNRVDDVGVQSLPGAITQVETLTCTSTPGITGITDLSGCYADSPTPSQYFSLTNYSSYSWKYTGLFKYYYPAGEYSWKAIVENAHVVNEKTYTADYSGMKIVPYKVGYGIPTAFSLITGFYDIGVTISGLGHNGHFDKVIQKELNVSSYNYACKYKVVNELYGEECNWNCNYSTQTCTLTADSPEYCEREVKGIDLVYRLIEMPNDVKLEDRRDIVFPSIDGDGREPGTNWQTFINEHTTGFTNVTSNNVVYDNNSNINTYGPIYEIELTPTAIGQIRNDTLTYRDTGKDPYTSYTNANNQEKVICEGEHTERTCASNFITTLIQNNVITGGYYLKCSACSTSTTERLKWIDSQKERFY